MRTFDHDRSITGGTGHPRSGCRQGTEMGCAAILARGIMINSRGERKTKALEGTEDFQQTPSNIRRRNQRVQTAVTTNPHMRSVEFSHVALGDPLATEVGLWIKLIPFIIIFDLIWFDSYFLFNHHSYFSKNEINEINYL